MKLLKPLALSFLIVLVAGSSDFVAAQESDSPQIYLDEPKKEPPPTVVRRNTEKQNYENESPRLERGIALLSNDLVINHGKYIEFYPDGQKFAEGAYDMGLHIDQWKYWHPNGQICKTISFIAGKPHGQWDVFRPDGTLEATKGYENGMRNGPWTVFFEDGKQHKIELTYEKGKLEGMRNIFFPNGQLRQQIPYENGLMHGTATTWNEEGQKLSEMHFEKGKLTGKPKQFDVTTKVTDQSG